MDYGQLKGIPIEYLVTGPLLAGARGNMALAEVNIDCFLKLAYKDGKGDDSTPRLLTFELERPYQANTANGLGAWEKQKISVTAPCAALLPLPALLVDKITIDFTTTISQESSTTVKVGSEVSASGGMFGWTVSAKVTTDVEHQRSSKQECTYQFHVEASQQPQAEGMSKLCDIFSSVIEPLPSTGG